MSISLRGSIRDCKVDTSWVERLQSDRFENPDNMMCPVWNGRDNIGRPVSEDSFYTKVEGCNTPLDRVDVENALRPQHMETVTTDAYGFRADLFQGDNGNGNRPVPAVFSQSSSNSSSSSCSPPPMCSLYPYDLDFASEAYRANYSRKAQFLQHLSKANEFNKLAGFGFA